MGVERLAIQGSPSLGWMMEPVQESHGRWAATGTESPGAGPFLAPVVSDLTAAVPEQHFGV